MSTTFSEPWDLASPKEGESSSLFVGTKRIHPEWFWG